MNCKPNCASRVEYIVIVYITFECIQLWDASINFNSLMMVLMIRTFIRIQVLYCEKYYFGLVYIAFYCFQPAYQQASVLYTKKNKTHDRDHFIRQYQRNFNVHSHNYRNSLDSNNEIINVVSGFFKSIRINAMRTRAF